MPADGARGIVVESHPKEYSNDELMAPLGGTPLWVERPDGTRPGLVARRAAYARRSRCEHRFVFALVAPHPLSDGTAARRGLGCRL
jgi:hypothetical protein